MKRQTFLAIAGSTIVVAGVTFYLLSDKRNFIRADEKRSEPNRLQLQPDEREILFLASLAPSGHNAQPWFIKYVEPYHWIIGNDKDRWLSGVDPIQRETILSIGAFLQNLEYAAGNLGYSCEFNILASINQDENIADVKFIKISKIIKYDIDKIKYRRSVHSNYLKDVLRKDDISYLLVLQDLVW